MKRYLLFAGSDYYPTGGWEDFQTDSDDLDALKAYAEEVLSGSSCDWAHIIDTENYNTHMPIKWMRIGKYWA